MILGDVLQGKKDYILPQFLLDKLICHGLSFQLRKATSFLVQEKLEYGWKVEVKNNKSKPYTQTDTHTRGFEEGEGPSLYIGEVG